VPDAKDRKSQSDFPNGLRPAQDYCAANSSGSRKEDSMEHGNLTILYERLSRDDGEDGVSNSILNQRQLLEDFANRNGLTPFLHIQDDGYSGTNWNRPGWQEVISKIEAGEATCLVVKDSSRMGRDYLRVGLYREMFREKNVRLIAVNDGLDTADKDDDFAPFREIMAEWYARDTSRKIKSVYHQKGMAGIRLAHHPLYGYKKADTSKNSQWIIDEPAAEFVRRIFALTIEGRGVGEIARILTEEQVESPAYHLAQMGYGQHVNKDFSDPYRWWASAPAAILSKIEYMGHTANFKGEKPHFKSKKYVDRPREDWVIFENTHEAIVDPETWATAKRCVSRIDGEPHPLTGLVFCADCGAKMYHQRRNNNTSKTPNDYVCATYRKHTTAHRISQKAIEELIFAALRVVVKYAVSDEDGFRKKVTEMFVVKLNSEMKSQRKRMTVCEKRSAELDRLIKKLFEDICCKGRKSNPSNTVKAAGSSVAVWAAQLEGGDTTLYSSAGTASLPFPFCVVCLNRYSPMLKNRGFFESANPHEYRLFVTLFRSKQGRVV